MSNLKEIRKGRVLSQAQLAAIVGVRQSSISQYEAGIRIPRWPLAIKIAAALDVQISDIQWGNTEDDTQESD